ncbi:MAG: M48 family metallopeptidase [Woeseiaceae bacterium]|nr:M48 family metallopeptidase [Woeseiaceae bacterium]
MNFFEAQDKARRASKWLVVVYLVATALIVAGVTLVFAAGLGMLSGQGGNIGDASGFLVAVAVITTLVIFGSSLYKTAVLSSGGGQVATSLGGTLVPANTTDPLRRRLRNVVEEMAIASGVPVPEIYVLEEESGINAFAAGYSPGDAAVAVTRGALELLDRDELQGVIGHEFSHILNGDMRLNIRMMGVLFGIMVISMIGRMILRGGYHASFSRSRSKGTAGVVAIGIGLAILGFIGMFFARVIKAAVSRQREYLADASAVQFTRQTEGIAGALKKIGGYSESSYITAADPEEVSHMLFGSGAKFAGIFATHPPLGERIRAIDPSFRAEDYPRVSLRETRARTQAAGTDAPTAGVTAALAGAVPPAAAITRSVGQPATRHIDYAKRIRESIPDSLYDAAHSSELAYLLTLALVLDRSGESLERQWQLLEERMGAERSRMIRRYFEELAEAGAEFRLPLLEVAFPALKLRPRPQLAYLVELARRLIEIDGKVDLYEFCFYRILVVNLDQAIDPSGRHGPRRASRRELRQAAVNLLAIIADHGHADAGRAQAALDAGLGQLGDWAQGVKIESKPDYTVAILDNSLDLLRSLSGKSRQKLMRAISEIAAWDGHLEVAEAELIRAICASLDCPLPPILAAD